MSLDAVVYTSLKNINLDITLTDFEVDEDTGEIFVDNLNASMHYSPELFISLTIRLGNVYEISEIRDKINQTLIDKFSDSIIVGKILYDSFHSGDKIEISEFDKLKVELEYIKQQTESFRSESLIDFIHNISKLVQVAEQENNPIVFI
jgi:hypothetical protein